MKRTALCFLFFVFVAAMFAQLPGPIPPVPPGQVPPAPAFPAALRLFLDLSDAQVDSMRNLNADYVRFATGKFRRVSQVQGEIADETAKSPLDPMGLGLRYAEIEAIRRQLVEEQAKLRNAIRAVLNDPQRARLKALEDIAKLLPIYGEAVSVNLIEGFGGFAPGARVGVFFGDRWIDSSSFRGPVGAEPDKENP